MQRTGALKIAACPSILPQLWIKRLAGRTRTRKPVVAPFMATHLGRTKLYKLQATTCTKTNGAPYLRGHLYKTRSLQCTSEKKHKLPASTRVSKDSEDTHWSTRVAPRAAPLPPCFLLAVLSRKDSSVIFLDPILVVPLCPWAL